MDYYENEIIQVNGNYYQVLEIKQISFWWTNPTTNLVWTDSIIFDTEYNPKDKQKNQKIAINEIKIDVVSGYLKDIKISHNIQNKQKYTAKLETIGTELPSELCSNYGLLPYFKEPYIERFENVKPIIDPSQEKITISVNQNTDAWSTMSSGSTPLCCWKFAMKFTRLQELTQQELNEYLNTKH
ncbi:hypothetical protein [Candidatus Lokiarchaeum ossiferum]|uniref:hypothetical protein n=1 Tax=Candidatus Lokiarchaeum ossiferum TaxID=2951803 RepID=UPI00352C6710